MIKALMPITEQNLKQIKREVLFFDKIIINEIDLDLAMTWFSKSASISKDHINFIDSEVNYLESKGLIEIYKEQDLHKKLKLKIQDTFGNTDGLRLSKQEVVLKLSYQYLFRTMGNKETYDSLSQRANGGIDSVRTNMLWLSRFIFDIIDSSSDYTQIMNSSQKVLLPNVTKKERVMELVINRMPIPDNEIGWEQILDFKSDEAIKRNLLGLRSWMTKIGHTKYTNKEIQQEIEYLLNEYENSIKLHKLKYQIGSTEVLITTALEVLENLLALKFSKAAKSIFQLKNKKIDMLIGETKTPGKELAYLSKNQGLFGKKPKRNE